MDDGCVALVQALGRLNPFSPLSKCWLDRRCILPSLMNLLRDDQYISLSPTETRVEDADMESGAAATGNAAQEQSQQVGRGLTRMPAVTPRLLDPKGVNFQQFCD